MVHEVGTLSDSIRDFVVNVILKPNFQSGEKEVIIKVGDGLAKLK